MAKVDYPIYRIRTEPHSPRVQSLRPGDVVRREYYDAPRTVYSLMVVLDTGAETVGEAEVPYFTGALIEGDEPRAGELLDFARITNLFDTERSGALYLTAADTEAPYMDVIDGLARDFALLWPEAGGGDAESPDHSRYARQGAEYLDERYTESEEDVSRIYRLTHTAYEGADAFGLKITLEQTVESPQRLLLSFKVRASAPLQGVPLSFGYADGSRLDYTDTIDAGIGWEYRLAVFTADYPASYLRSLRIDLTGRLTEGRWLEIAELNLVRLEEIASFGRATKGRVGKIRGVVDPVFGRLDGYGAYFRNLYASGDVHIAGTLTAADERGFASTFYVGRIHRNCVLNSLQPQFTPKATWIASGAPTGIGGYCRVSSGTAILEIQSEEWSKAHDGQWYCFSFWARTGSPHKLTVGHGRRASVSVALTAQWQRFYYTFRVQRIQGSKMAITFTKGVIFDLAAPQLEAGMRPTPYQPTDGVLRETDEYGAWFARGGIGGTIQHPLLRLDDDGAIRAGDDSFVINPDGTGHFAAGRFRWTADTIALQDFTIRWEDLSEEARENLKGEKGESGKDGEAILPDWVADWDSGKTVIDGSSVITPKIFAGVKNIDGTVTGVALGRYELLSRNEAGQFQSETINGLYGFHGGQKTFAIDTTGSIIIGRGEESIRYDAGTGKISFGKAVSMQWAGVTYIDANGIFTGMLSADTVRAVTIDAAQITAGVIAAERLDVDTLKARLLTAENIEALTLDVERGTIGGWTIDSEAIFRGTKCNTVGGYTAGPGAMTLSSNGIRGYQWRLEASGAGAVAGGRIAWDAAGKVTFAEEVSLNWSAPVGAITTALGGESYPRLTYISSTGIYTGTLTAQQVNAVSIDAGSIRTGTLSAERIAAGSITAGKLDAESIRADIINTSYIEGLALNFRKGRIGGWTIGASTLASSHILLDSGNRRVAVYGAGGSSTAGHRVQIYYNSDNDFGLWASDASGIRVAALGSMNEIAGWHIEASRIWKNNVSLGADGSIANGSKWKLNNDGSGSIASGNISWNAAGAVTFGASVSLQWKNDIEAAKSANYGYRYYKKVVVYGDLNLYYPVVFKGGDQTVQRDIMVRRSFNEQAPAEWNNGSTTHMGGLNLLIRTNFGGWGGTGYSWEIYDLQEAYSRMFGGATHCGNWCMFAVFLRGGGTTGAVYHLYSDQPIESTAMSPAPIPAAPQIAYGSDRIFQSGSATANAPAPRTLTASVEEEIRRHRFIVLTQSNDTTLKEHPLTYISSSGIYTGTLSAQQVNAVSIDAGSIRTGTLSADRLDAGSIKADKLDAAGVRANIVNASYINGLDLNFSRGKIGGWTIGADHITAGSVGTYGATPIQIRSASAGSGYWYEGSYKPLGISMLWRQIGNAGHFVFGQVAATPTTVKTGFIGLQMMDWEGLEYFCLSTSYARSGSKEVYNRIAGWAFDHTRIWKNNVSLGADGSIANGSKWKLNNDGSGSIASGNISWNAAGAVTFASSVSLQWTTPINNITSALGGSSYPKLTKISSTGIYTGTINASQLLVNSAIVVGGSTYAGSISVRDAGNAVKVTLDRTGITAVGGKIGGWSLTSSSIYAGSVYLSSAGNIYNGSYWRLSSDGSGYLARNNISWTAAGVLTMKGATIQDAVIKGTLRSPFVMVDGSIWIEIGPDGSTSSSSSKPEADKYDNICVQAGTDSGGWYLQQPELPWDVSQSGRRLCLTHYRYGSSYVYGTSTFTAPSGKYFYENGRLSTTLNMSRQVVELIGFGTSTTFYGWIVLNRRDLGTQSRYGEYLQYLAMGSVTLNSGYSITFKQKTYDGTKMSVSRTGTGIFTVYLPWSLGVDQYMVILSGKMSPVFNTSIYATVRYQYASSFVVHTQDDASQNDGSFNFIIASTADFV